MKIINCDFTQLNNYGNLTITIGKFDGVHLGHTKLIKNVISYRETKAAVMVLIEENTNFLFSLEDRIEKLKKFKLDFIFLVPFTKEFQQLDNYDFIKLLTKMGVSRIVCGNDFRFGKDAAGTPNDLIHAFQLHICTDLLINEVKVSTSQIKSYLQQGKLDMAFEMLGYPFSTTGVVLHGSNKGREIGYNTANIEYANLFLPRNGVYSGELLYKKKRYKAVLNIGHNPTFNYKEKASLEIHILDFDKEIYEETVTVFYKNFLRTEQKFKTKEELIKQIHLDIQKTLRS